MGRVREAINGMNGGKGRLLILAGMCVAVGVVLNAGGYVNPQPSMGDGAEARSALRTDWASGSRKGAEVEERVHTWGDAAIRFGGSFMIAMLIGSLLRVFVRTMVIALVAGGIVLWILTDRGMFEPSWENAFGSWGQAKDWLVMQTRSVTDFLRGYVPSMTAGLVGLGFGLRK